MRKRGSWRCAKCLDLDALLVSCMCKLAAVTSVARCYKGPTCLADQAELESTGHLYLGVQGGLSLHPWNIEAVSFTMCAQVQYIRQTYNSKLACKIENIMSCQEWTVVRVKNNGFHFILLFNASQRLVAIPLRFTR